jgi:hypothetical protein
MINEIKRLSESLSIDKTTAITALKLFIEVIECMQDEIDLLDDMCPEKQIRVDCHGNVETNLLYTIMRNTNGELCQYHRVDEDNVEDVIFTLAELGYIKLALPTYNKKKLRRRLTDASRNAIIT